MRFAPHPGATRRFGPPAGWDPETQGECGTLEIADVERPAGFWSMESLWRPEAGDLAAIAAGAGLVLGVCGPSPFLSLNVVEEGRRLPLFAGERLTIDQMNGDVVVGMGLAGDDSIYPFFQRAAARQGGTRFLESYWALDEEARTALAGGALIALQVGGSVHPVVYLGVEGAAETPR